MFTIELIQRHIEKKTNMSHQIVVLTMQLVKKQWIPK